GPGEAVPPVDRASRPPGAVADELPVVVRDRPQKLGDGRVFKECRGCIGHGSVDFTRCPAGAQPRGGDDEIESAREGSMSDKTALSPKVVEEFVGKAHGDLNRVAELLEQEP